MKTSTPLSGPQHSARPAQVRTRRLGVLTGAFCAAGFVIWPGCISPPLPSSRTPVGSVRRSDVRAAKREQLTKAEIVHRLGKPDVWYPDFKVACYKLNDVSRRRLVLLFGVVPIGVPEDNKGLEVAMFQFDAQGGLLRSTRRTVRDQWWSSFSIQVPVSQPPSNETLRDAAEQWARRTAKVN